MSLNDLLKISHYYQLKYKLASKGLDENNPFKDIQDKDLKNLGDTLMNELAS